MSSEKVTSHKIERKKNCVYTFAITDKAIVNVPASPGRLLGLPGVLSFVVIHELEIEPKFMQQMHMVTLEQLPNWKNIK